MIQQQSASRVQLPSLSASKERKHGKQRQLSGRRTKATKARAHGESDVSSDQDSDQSGGNNSSDGEGSASSPTDDGSSEEVIAMSQRTKHVHKKRRSKLKRNDSGSKTFPDKLLRSGVWPWLAQACATFEDVENNEQSEVAACVVSSGSLTFTLSSSVRPHWG